MQANEKFTLRITPEDRKNFAELKRYLKRSSQSDAIRYIAREMVKVFRNEEKPEPAQKPRSRK